MIWDAFVIPLFAPCAGLDPFFIRTAAFDVRLLL
jgi:hypothetical protein